MSIQLELTPEEEALLRDHAVRLGKTAEEWVGGAVRSLLLAGDRPQDASGLSRQERWDQLMSSIKDLTRSGPANPPDARTREELYLDHD